MIIDSPIISGSSAASGSLNQFGNVAITGSLTVTGAIIGAVTGSVNSASYASNAELLDGRDSTTFTSTSSFQNYTSSNDAQVLQLNNVSASLNSYTSSNNANIADLNAATASLYNATSSIYLATASLNLATASIYGATSSLFAYTASNSANVANLFATSASLNAAVVDIRNATASLYAATASIYGATSSLFNYSASSNLRINALDQYTASLNTRSASFACIDSTNNFACAQYFSNASNVISFTSTGSLYSDGGMRITKDMYVSGTAYFNNVTVFGTQSVAYISSSQLNIGTNIISVNTDTPTIRFGGLAVYDSGSTGLTGSILWDSEQNHWVYTNPSGSTYSGGMFISGPRSAALGSEQGTTACALMMGQGGDHITSSAIFHYGNATCIPNTLVGSTICTTMANASCIGVGITTPSAPLHVGQNGSAAQLWLQRTDGYNPVKLIGGTLADGNGFKITMNTTDAFSIASDGVSCFVGTICAPKSRICSTGDLSYIYNSGASTTDANLYIYNSTTDILMVRNSGCVGIGTPNPLTKLDIVGNNNLLGSTNTLRFTDTDTATELNQQIGKIEFFSCDTTTPGAGVKAYIGAFAADTSPDAYIAFATQDGSATPDPVERLRITSEGNVQIGYSGAPAYTGKLFISRGDQYGLTINSFSGGTCFTSGDDNILFNFGVNNTLKMFCDYSNCFRGTVCAPQFRANVGGCGCIAFFSANGNIVFDNGSISAIGNMGNNASQFSVSSRGCLTFRVGESGAPDTAPLRFLMDTNGVSCFSSTVCASRLQVFNTSAVVAIEGTATNGEATLSVTGKNSSGTSRSAIFKYDNIDAIRIGTADAITMRFETSDVTRLCITSTGIAVFACQVCAPAFVGSTATLATAGTACAVSGVLTLASLQTGPASVCAGAAIVFEGNAGATVARIYSRGNMNFNNGSDLVFQTQVSAAGTPQCTMVINGATQNVGIGTFNPGYKLEVRGYTFSAGYILNPELGIETVAGSPYAGMFTGVSSFPGGYGSVIISSRPDLATPIVFATSNGSVSTERIRIAGTGIACFACQVCAKSLWFSSNTTGQITFGSNDACNAYVVSDSNNGLYLGNNNSYKIFVPNDGADMIFRTSPTYGNPCERMRITSGGNILPGANGTQDLGSSSLRWCTVYTSDLSLNNGIGNYTIVEGENDLFLYNNNSCKVYKFVVQEVCPEIAPAKRSI